MNTTDITNNEAQPSETQVITPDLDAPIFFIEDKRGQDYEPIRNSRKKLTGDMDLISHFGLYYLYEMSKYKKVDDNSNFQSYINDLPIKEIIKNTKLRDLVIAQPTQKIPVVPIDQEILDTAYTLKVGPFPQDDSLDTSFFSDRKKKLEAQKKDEKIKQDNESTSIDNKGSKVTLKINMSYNDYENPKRKRSYTMDPEESEKLKKKHKKKKYRMDEYPSNI
ncbi:hypothetical protein BCR36DRAFT_349274 [Piromyces finnis]|uniref:Mediator of RNA polymerase II transcription subunit 19 n=1 Tax=Piromyces finnis TaxID=1754191 RepID=A0A1Y1VEI4_9FUNG|nr:hypothetical protein BCR36DRAFT_349274 [Piromyces finnis]|eukprot:ORX53386.1 hypothetical protein BCR36DRAFT_349274 [Piromyces finnis]